MNMATKKTSYEAPTPASDKKKALQTALAQIEKNFGKVRIEHNPPYGFYVYLPKDNETYVQFCYNIDYLNGWLYGAV